VCNPRNNRTEPLGRRRRRDALPRDPRQHLRWLCPVYPPPMVDALGRVRHRTSETPLWTCGAGRAGTRIRSKALHQRLTIGRLAADRAGARPYHRLTKLIVKPRGLFAETLSTRPPQRLPSKTNFFQPTVILDSSAGLCGWSQPFICPQSAAPSRRR
jgi:hypothetical protein